MTHLDVGSAGVEPTALLRLTGVTKAFGSTRAVDGVDLLVLPGELVGLVGQNGSGKSTVIKLVTKVHRNDAGELEVAPETRFRSAYTLRNSGGAVAGLGEDSPLSPVNVVQQDLALAPGLSVTENIRLRELGGGALRKVDWKFEASEARAALGLVPNGDRIRVDEPVRLLSESQRALVALARALWPVHGREAAGLSSLILLDETTSRLTGNDSKSVFAAVRSFLDRGSGGLLVSHKLDEVLAHCDRVVALRNGAVVWEGRSEDTDVPALVGMITGMEQGGGSSSAQRRAPAVGSSHSSAPELFRVEGLTGDGIDGLSFGIRAGEILGIAGLPDSGVSSLGQLVVGSRPRKAGSVHLGSSEVPATVREALEAGLILLPEDRLLSGLNLKTSVAENLTFSALNRVSTRGRLHKRLELALCEELIERYGVVPADPMRPVAQLSGGNQQKVLLARVAESGARVFLIEGLSRGVDVASREILYTRLRDLVASADDIAVVLLAWTEFDDIEALAQRVLIVRNGAVSQELSKDRMTRADVESAIYRELPYRDDIKDRG